MRPSREVKSDESVAVFEKKRNQKIAGKGSFISEFFKEILMTKH